MTTVRNEGYRPGEFYLRWKHRYAVFRLAVAFIALTFWLFWLLTYVIEHIHLLPDMLASSLAQVGFALSVFFIGGGFWVLKKYALGFYAVLELAGAFAMGLRACAAVAADKHVLGWGFALLGALFLAVRGFENLERYLKGRKEPKVAEPIPIAVTSPTAQKTPNHNRSY